MMQYMPKEEKKYTKEIIRPEMPLPEKKASDPLIVTGSEDTV